MLCIHGKFCIVSNEPTQQTGPFSAISSLVVLSVMSSDCPGGIEDCDINSSSLTLVAWPKKSLHLQCYCSLNFYDLFRRIAQVSKYEEFFCVSLVPLYLSVFLCRKTRHETLL